MKNTDLFSRMQEVLNAMNHMQHNFECVQENIQQSLDTVKQYQDEIKTIQSQLRLIMDDFYCQQQIKPSDKSASVVNKNTEPMSVKDAIEFLRNSKVHLSNYGYHLRSSLELRYAALKDALQIYPIEDVLQKLRVLIIVWSQNTADHIKSAEKYLNNLRVDFHRLREECLKQKRM